MATKVVYDCELTVAPSTAQSLARQIDDSELLGNIGYKQDFKRSFSLLSMVGFCFSIVACWCALAASLAEVMQNGGPAVLVFGWIGCCALSMFVVLVLSELCSAYPVAGGQYSWCLLLSKDTYWGRAVSYSCAWIQLSGIIGMMAVGAYQFATQVAAAAALNNDKFEAANWTIALIAYGSTLFALFVSLFGVKILHHISAAALWWSIGGFVVCTVAVLACAPTLEPASFVFTTVTAEGWSSRSMAIIVGLMQPAYGMCTYDSVAHLAEETESASKQCPRAMVLSVLIGFVTGFVFVLALLYSIQDLNAVVNTRTGLPLLEIFYQATRSKAGSTCLVAIVFISQMFTNISLTTNASRTVYAFARDGAFPAVVNEWLMNVSPTLHVPVWAMLVACGVNCALIAILFGSATAFFTVLSIASTGLYASYLCPIVVYMFRREHKAPGYYNLGKWSLFCGIPAILYLVFCLVFFFFPTQIPVTANNMNYDIVALGIVTLLALISWFSGGRKNYIRDIEIQEGIEIVAPDATAKEKAEKSI